MDKHTAGPWTVLHEFDNEPTYIIAQGDVDIATLPEYIDHEERLANAAFIVRAVNCHDDLLEALREILKQYRNVRIAEKYPPGDSRSMKTAIDAIAKATGE